MVRLIKTSVQKSARRNIRSSRICSHTIIRRIHSPSEQTSSISASKIKTAVVTPAWANSTDYKVDIKKKKSKLRKKRIGLCLIIGTILCIITTVVLLVLLLRPKQQSKLKSKVTPILRWNPVGITVAGISGVAGSNNSQLNNPWGLALTYDSTLYVADRFNNRIQKFRRNSSIGETLDGLAFPILNGPAAIVLDSEENLYIADGYNHEVKFWTKSTNSTRTIAGTGISGNTTNQLYYPYGITRDWNSDNLYIADHYNHRIIVSHLNINSCSVFVNNIPLNLPISVHFDSISQSLLVSNLGTNQILRWIFQTNQWQIIVGSMTGLSGNDAMSLNAPLGITLDPMGNLYVVDLNNHRVQFFPTNELNGTTIAGVVGQDGINSTLLHYPYNVILDTQLNMYVSDNQNHRVQKFLRF